MSKRKKRSSISAVLGFIFVAAGILALIVALKMPHYSAIVTNVAESSTADQQSGGARRRGYSETVTAEYVDNNGSRTIANNLSIKKNSEAQLPKVGDTIEVSELFGVKEYSVVMPIASFVVLLLLGMVLIIPAFAPRKKKKRRGATRYYAKSSVGAGA